MQPSLHLDIHPARPKMPPGSAGQIGRKYSPLTVLWACRVEPAGR